MVYKTNKERGNAGMALAIAFFGSNGYTVSIPLNDTQDYDLIVDKEGILSKVQVKYTSFQRYKNTFVLDLKSAGGTNGSVYKTLKNTDYDLLFILCSDRTMYLIPKKEIIQNSSINLKKEESKNSRSIFKTSEYIVKI